MGEKEQRQAGRRAVSVCADEVFLLLRLTRRAETRVARICPAKSPSSVIITTGYFRRQTPSLLYLFLTRRCEQPALGGMRCCVRCCQSQGGRSEYLVRLAPRTGSFVRSSSPYLFQRIRKPFPWTREATQATDQRSLSCQVRDVPGL